MFPLLENEQLLGDTSNTGNFDVLFIIVPGLFGNELYYRNEKKNTEIKVYPPSYNQFLRHKMNVAFKNSSWDDNVEKYILNPKIKLYPGKVIKSYMGKNIYKLLYTSIKNDLDKSGIIRTDICEFTYDWRKPLDTIAAELCEFIKFKCLMIKYKMSDVILIGHSYGGYIMRMVMELTEYAFFEGVDRIKKCVFASCPFFGKHNLFEMYKCGHDLKTRFYSNSNTAVYENTIVNEDKIQELEFKIIRYFNDNCFFSEKQLLQMFTTFKHSLLLLLRLNEVSSLNVTSVCNTLEIDVNYYMYIMKVLEQMSTLKNKRSTIEYICIYNTVQEKRIDQIGLRDGYILYNVHDLNKMNNCSNFVQIRENNNALTHVDIFNSPFVLKHLIGKFHLK